MRGSGTYKVDVEVIDDDGEVNLETQEFSITAEDWGRLQLPQLLYESYFIAKGYVQLTYADLHNLPGLYAQRLTLVLQTMDKIAAEEQKKRMKK